VQQRSSSKTKQRPPRPRPLIPEGLEPRPERVEFKDSDPIAPGFVTLRGNYRNDRGQRFTLTATALVRDADALRRFTGILRVWLVALEAGSGTDAEQGPNADRPDLESLVREGERCGDEPVLALDVNFQCDGVDPEAYYTIVGRFETSIGGGERRCFKGPNQVVASGNNATLGGLTDRPHQVGLPPSRNRGANNHCWVQGGSGGGNYSIDCAWAPVRCKT
jgi:hypothetical protein